MDANGKLKKLLEAVQDGTLSVENGLEQLRDLPYRDIGHTRIDLHRQLRNGFPEVIYGAGKTPEQVTDIVTHMHGQSDILATRVSSEMAAHVLKRFPDMKYNPVARTLTHEIGEKRYREGKILIVTAGTSDLGVAEEARVTCEMLGNRTSIMSDVGVAGIHRLLDRLEELRQASVLIVIAGMEGALGGLVRQPIIAVPTSVGYGANFSGLSALLGMLTSCASGVTVVNIDNGFGAACAADKINMLVEEAGATNVVAG